MSNLGVLGTERADGLAGAPDLEVADLVGLLLEGLAVVGAASEVESALGLGTVAGGLVELLEEGLEVVLEALGPVEGTTAGGGGAGLVHVVHAVGTDQRVEGLGGLLDGLVEGLAGAVAVLTENLVLGEEHTVDTTHEAATLTVEVRVDLLLEGGLVEVAGTDGDTHGDGLLEGLASHILVDGDGAVDTAALLEERADSAARALGGDEDNVNVVGDLDVGAVLEDGGETVGEVEGLRRALVFCFCFGGKCGLSTYLALGEHGLDARPGLLLGGVTEQVHDDGTLLDSLVNLEKVDARLPAILDGLLPAGAVFSDTNDDVEAVVAEVEALAVTLGAVADEGEGVVLEVLLEGGQSRAFSEPLEHGYVQGASHGASRRALSSSVSHWVPGMRN
jgi:hypothetical protein